MEDIIFEKDDIVTIKAWSPAVIFITKDIDAVIHDCSNPKRFKVSLYDNKNHRAIFWINRKDITLSEKNWKNINRKRLVKIDELFR